MSGASAPRARTAASSASVGDATSSRNTDCRCRESLDRIQGLQRRRGSKGRNPYHLSRSDRIIRRSCSDLGNGSDGEESSADGDKPTRSSMRYHAFSAQPAGVLMSSLFSLFGGRSRRATQLIAPERSLDEVVLPERTRQALEQALAEVRNHSLIFDRWGLGERHATGLGLAFNFAGPPGTGKTICAEAIAHALGMKLLVVDYAEVESMWMGETPKNIAGVFRAAAEQSAVLFFDEADAIAARRGSGLQLPDQRESNLNVHVLLRELEAFNGIVIFATNLAANFDPAFERRIRTHVLFEMP